MLPEYSWNGITAEPCDKQYRLGKREVEDDIIINCTDCPFGTSYNNDNGCKLNTGYSWPSGEFDGSINNDLYNVLYQTILIIIIILVKQRLY